MTPIHLQRDADAKDSGGAGFESPEWLKVKIEGMLDKAFNIGIDKAIEAVKKWEHSTDDYDELFEQLESLKKKP